MVDGHLPGPLEISFGHPFATIPNSDTEGNYFERPAVFLAMDYPEIFLDAQAANLVEIRLSCSLDFSVPAGVVRVGCLPFFFSSFEGGLSCVRN